MDFKLVLNENQESSKYQAGKELVKTPLKIPIKKIRGLKWFRKKC